MYWGSGIFGFSPCFTHFYLFAHIFLLISTTSTLFLRREGPKRSKGHYMEYEIGSMDGAYKGRLHVACPFIGRSA